MEWGVLIGVLVSAAWIAAHIVLMHIKPSANRIGAMTGGYLVSLPLVFAAWLCLPMPEILRAAAQSQSPLTGLPIAYLTHLLIYFLFVECFYHVERAVTLRMLIEIMRHPADGVPMTEIQERYNTAEMIRIRLGVLEEHGYIRRDGDRWHLEPKGLLFARVMAVSAWIYQSTGQPDRL